MIPYSHQSISQEDIDAVVEVLKSEWLTQGPAIERFEEAFSRYCHARHSVAVSHGTSALHLACLALDFGPGDLLWTSPNTFVASANCAVYCGGNVDFVDIDPQTYNLCADALEQKLLTAERDGQLPKIVVAVHFAGQSCDMQRIHALSQRFGFFVIEDACHALGGRYQNEPVGNCRYSDLTVFSFHPVKGITTGEGGMVVTNNEELALRGKSLRSHGITRDKHQLIDKQQGAWYYEQQGLGYNYRMTDMQAALGLSQLQRNEQFLSMREHLASRYDQAFDGLSVEAPWLQADCMSSRHLYPVCFAGEEQRLKIYNGLLEGGINAQVHYFPLHLQPFYQQRGFSRGDFPNAENYYQRTLSLPLFVGLTESNQDRVIAALVGLLQA